MLKKLVYCILVFYFETDEQTQAIRERGEWVYSMFLPEDRETATLVLGAGIVTPWWRCVRVGVGRETAKNNQKHAIF